MSKELHSNLSADILMEAVILQRALLEQLLPSMEFPFLQFNLPTAAHGAEQLRADTQLL